MNAALATPTRDVVLATKCRNHSIGSGCVCHGDDRAAEPGAGEPRASRPRRLGDLHELI